MASHDPRERFALLAVWLLRLSLAQFIHERSQGLTAPLHGTYLFLAIIDIFAGIPGTVYCCVGSRPIESCISADEFYCFLEAIRHHHWRDDIPCENVKMWGMDELAAHLARRQRVIKAGARVFLRFGFARATMGDIAEAAGMSRPALYLLFRDKEDVFEAVVAHWIEDSLARIGAGLAERDDARGEAAVRLRDVVCGGVGAGACKSGRAGHVRTAGGAEKLRAVRGAA